MANWLQYQIKLEFWLLQDISIYIFILPIYLLLHYAHHFKTNLIYTIFYPEIINRHQILRPNHSTLPIISKFSSTCARSTINASYSLLAEVTSN